MASGSGSTSGLRSSTHPADVDSKEESDTKPQSSGGNEIPSFSTEPSDDDTTSRPATKPSTDSKAAQYDVKNVLLNSNAQKVNDINVMVFGDKLHSCITGCCFMPGGSLVLYDFGNKKIKRLNSSLSAVDSLSIPGGDWDTAVAAVDNSNVIVTIADKKQLQLIQVLSSLKIGCTIDVDRYCNGVAVAADKIFVLCESTNKTDEIRVFDLAGRDLGNRHAINLSDTNLFVSPFYIAVSKAGGTIFISDRDTHTVSCMSSDGDILYQYRDEGLQRPCGLFVDDKDNVLVCGDNSHNVQLITAVGKKHKNMLTSKDGISNPICVSFRSHDGTLVVGCWDNHGISVYRMS